MNLESFMRFLSKHWGEIYTFLDVAKNVKGVVSKKNPDEDLPPEEKPKGGIFRSGDEINWINATIDLPKEKREILYGLLEYHFGDLNNPKNFLVAAISFVQYNKWRTMVTELDTPSRKVGTRDIVTVKATPNKTGSDKGGNETKVPNQNTKTVTEKKEIYAGGVKNTKKLINQLVEIIESEQGREDGYKKAVDYLRSLNIPMMPKRETLDWIDANLSPEKVQGWINNIDLEATADWTTTKTRPVRARIRAVAIQKRKEKAERKRKNIFVRFFHWLAV